MPAIVGLLAPNGRVGAAALRHLTAAHVEGKLTLVVLCRPNSPPRRLTQGVGIEIRTVDLEGDQEQIFKAVNGLNVVVSTIAATALHLQVPLVEALAKSPDLITWIPSKFGAARWTSEEERLPQIANFNGTMNAGSKRAQELGVSITTVNAGIFDEFMFGFGFLGADIKTNKIRLSNDHMRRGLPITSVDYLGAVLATLASRPPNSIANKEFSAMEIQPSGQDLIDAFTNIHGGKQPELIDFTEKDRQKLLQESGLGPVAAAYLKSWADNSFDLGEVVKVPTFEAKTLEQMVRIFAS